MTDIRIEDMKKGVKYEVRYRIEGVQRYDRKSVMVFLGIDERSLLTPQKYGPVYVFSARPAAGTQDIHRAYMISAKEVHPNTPCFVGARA